MKFPLVRLHCDFQIPAQTEANARQVKTKKAGAVKRSFDHYEISPTSSPSRKRPRTTQWPSSPNQAHWSSLWSAITPTVTTAASMASKAIVDGVKHYHSYKVQGLENIPKTGPVLLVLNHSLATYDVGLLANEIQEKTGRIPKPLVERLFFKIPGISDVATQFGMVEGTRDNARKLLNAGELVIVLPGGMKEALKPSTEKYHVKWEQRKGFVRIALETGATVVVGACPAADDIYTVYDNPITQTVYDHLRAPLPIFAGRYYTALPMATELTHVLSKPIPMPKLPDSKMLSDEMIDDKRQLLQQTMDMAIAEALKPRTTNAAIEAAKGKR